MLNKILYKVMSRKLTFEEFEKMGNETHNSKYIYLWYKDIHTKVPIIYPIHGIFWQEPNKHIHRGHGCPLCNGGIKKAKEHFTGKAEKIHGKGRYSYNDFIYINSKTLGKIHCNICGRDFMMSMDNHTNKNHAQGCPYCKQSKMERAVSIYLEENDIQFIYQANKTLLEWLKTSKGSFSLDFYFPQWNMAIECQGEQHFNAREQGIFTVEKVDKIKERDKEKLKRCLEHNIIIEYINYDEDVITKLNKILNKYMNELDSNNSERY